jgi:hypothetical protein
MRSWSWVLSSMKIFNSIYEGKIAFIIMGWGWVGLFYGFLFNMVFGISDFYEGIADLLRKYHFGGVR